MTLQEILKNQGYTEEQIKAVTDAMKENGIFTASEENLDIRYGKLKTDHEGLTKQYQEAQTLITNLKKDKKTDEDTQAKITAYEGQVQQLQEELTKAKIEAAVKVKLLEAGAKDIDYMIYKLNAKADGDGLTLDDKGNVKGLDDMIAGLQTQMPNQFETKTKEEKKIEEKKLPSGDGDGKITAEEFQKMGYQARAQLFNEDPETYRALAGN